MPEIAELEDSASAKTKLSAMIANAGDLGDLLGEHFETKNKWSRFVAEASARGEPEPP